MARATCGLLLLCLLASPVFAERKWFVRPTRAEQIREMHGPYNSAEALRSPAERTPLINDLPFAPSREPAAAEPQVNAPPAAVMAEIIKIRRSTQSVDPAEEAEFVEALRDVVGAKKSPTPQESEADAASTGLPERYIHTSEELVDSLRMSARQLDVVAANYEERGEYGLADKTRQIAHSLRQEARGLICGAAKPAPQPAD